MESLWRSLASRHVSAGVKAVSEDGGKRKRKEGGTLPTPLAPAMASIFLGFQVQKSNSQKVVTRILDKR